MNKAEKIIAITEAVTQGWKFAEEAYGVGFKLGGARCGEHCAYGAIATSVARIKAIQSARVDK